MKENKYDNEQFFNQYSRFERSVQGLSAAGEWHELQKLLPAFAGQRVLDIGCGFGWHCLYAAEQGASRIVGTDISQKMLEVAKEKSAAFPQIEYRRTAMEDLDFAPGEFDVALSSLALHYTPDYAGVCEKVFRLLALGGVFVFSCEHPVFTACGHQQWAENEAGEKLHWPVDRYFAEGARDALFLGERVTKYHRTLTSYLNTLLEAGFAITAIVEPQPAPQLLDEVPGMRDELRRPMMLLVRAEKK